MAHPGLVHVNLRDSRVIPVTLFLTWSWGVSHSFLVRFV